MAPPHLPWRKIQDSIFQWQHPGGSSKNRKFLTTTTKRPWISTRGKIWVTPWWGDLTILQNDVTNLKWTDLNEIIMEQSDQILQESVMENWVPPFGGSLWPNSLHTIQSVALNYIHRKGFESWSTNTIKGHPTTQGAWWNSCNYDQQIFWCFFHG